MMFIWKCNNANRFSVRVGLRLHIYILYIKSACKMWTIFLLSSEQINIDDILNINIMIFCKAALKQCKLWKVLCKSIWQKKSSAVRSRSCVCVVCGLRARWWGSLMGVIHTWISVCELWMLWVVEQVKDCWRERQWVSNTLRPEAWYSHSELWRVFTAELRRRTIMGLCCQSMCLCYVCCKYQLHLFFSSSGMEAVPASE